jgi:amino acid transporter
MVGSAIFVTLPLVLSAMRGPHAAVAWLLGMLIALSDGLVWAELGAALPGSGGTYVYLREAFGSARWGRLWSFVFVWGAAIAMPLICAFIGVSLAQYMQHLWVDMTFTEGKAIAIGSCATATVLAYRDIRSVGRVSLWMFAVLAVIALWVVSAGLSRFDWGLVSDVPPDAFSLTREFFGGLGTATLIALFDYGGYHTVCLCGGEVHRPERTIPLSIIYAVVIVAAFYFLTTLAVVGVVPWREAAGSPHVVSELIVRSHGATAGAIVTILVVIATFSSLFTTLVGFSRVLFAAAVDGQFFAMFASLHPIKRFPSTSVLALGGISMLLCLLPLDTLLRSVAGLAALTQSIPQVIALLVIRRRRSDIPRPFRMWLYPVPALVALAGFAFVLVSNERWIVFTAATLALIGVAVYMLRAHTHAWWPFSKLSVVRGGQSTGGSRT